MSDKLNEALFDLIVSMSKSEKRYFKLFSARHTIGDENNYVRLFDFISKLENYCEKNIHTSFKGEAFLNRFSITKKRLYDHILTALDSYHLCSSIEAQLFRMLHSSDILFDKALYDQSRRILRSAEKLALKHGKNEIILAIVKKQKRLLETKGYLSATEKDIDKIGSREKLSLSCIEKFNEIWAIKSKLFERLSKKGVARCNGESADYKRICVRLINGYDLENTNVETRYLFHHALSAYYFAIGNLEDSLDSLEQNLLLINDEENLQKIEPNKLVSVLTNAIYVSDKMGYRKKSLNYLNELKKRASMVESNEDLEIKLFSSITSIEFSMCLRRGNFISARKIAVNVETQLEEYGDKIVPIRRAFLEFKMAVVYMGLGEYNTALKWVNQILNDTDVDKTEDIVGFTQLLDLLIHIELKNVKLLPYSLKSTLRFFKTRNRLYSFEKVFLQFIGKLIKSDDYFESEILWEELSYKLNATTDDAFESVALDYFDFKSWAEAKLKRKAFHEVVREKFNQTIKIAS
jgi:hypothetical protein